MTISSASSISIINSFSLAASFTKFPTSMDEPHRVDPRLIEPIRLCSGALNITLGALDGSDARGGSSAWMSLERADKVFLGLTSRTTYSLL